MRCTAACRKERLDPLHLAMDKLSFANNAYRDNAIKHSFLEEQEIDYRRLNFKMKHGRKSLQIERRLLSEIKSKEEKDSNTTDSLPPLEVIESKIRGAQYMLIRFSTDMATGKDGAGDQELPRQLKQLEVEREKVVANCVVGGKIWSSLGSIKTIKEYIEAEHKEAEESKENRRRLQVEIKSVRESLKRLEEGHSSVQSQLNDLRTRKQQVREQILDLKKQLARRPTKKRRKERVKTSKTNQL
ncbi:unnamed protein product [Linum trigynum]|uniref:Uncharacterized protein n=1 Tax=Linum trigynum TaxID=586398 RepID=A0AAV2G9M5_9ROSI